MKPVRFPFRAATLLLLGGALAGCSRQEDSVRRYTEIYLPPSAPPSAQAEAVAVRAGTGLTWQTPEGWLEKPGDGMRLATFVTGGEDVPSECTLVTFPGDVGGEAANIRRWAGQLNAPLTDDRLESFLAGKEAFTTAGGWAGSLYDFRPLTEGRDTSMLASIIALEDAQAFVKLIAPPQRIEQERDRFLALCTSLK